MFRGRILNPFGTPGGPKSGPKEHKHFPENLGHSLAREAVSFLARVRHKHATVVKRLQMSDKVEYESALAS